MDADIWPSAIGVASHGFHGLLRRLAPRSPRVPPLILAMVALLGWPGLRSLEAAEAPPQQPSVSWLRPGDLPDHLQLTLRAMSARITSARVDDRPRVQFSPRADAEFEQLPLKPRGFNVANLLIGNMEAATKSRAPRYQVDGTLTLASSGARRAVLFFEIRYGFDNKRFVIEDAIVRPILPAKPMIAILMLPGKVREADLLGSSRTFEAAYQSALERAYDLGKPSEDLAAPGEVLFVAPVFDWLPDSAAANLWVSENPDNIDPPREAPRLASFGGWRLYMRRATLDFAAGQKYYVKIAWSRPEQGINSPAELVAVAEFPQR